MNERQTVRGNKKNSINGQSAHLDIEIWDVVQEPLGPLSWVCCAILPLPPGLGFLNIKVRWEKDQRAACGCDEDLVPTSDRPRSEQKGDKERENRNRESGEGFHGWRAREREWAVVLEEERRAVINLRKRACEKTGTGFHGARPCVSSRAPADWNLGSHKTQSGEYDSRQVQYTRPSTTYVRAQEPRHYSFARRNASNSSSNSCWLF